MKMSLSGIICSAILLSLTVSAQAQDTAAFQLSTLDNTNVPDVAKVEGARFALIYGKSNDVSGIDLSLGYSELDNMTGISLPLYIGANRIHGEMKGVSFGIFNWHEGSDTGANIGALNMTNDVEGLNLGLVNISTGSTLADVSAINISKKSNFQLAFFNNTDDLQGLQIGLLNCADNGFFPCFPFFNFGK
jgi:hypothetical protein